MLSEYLVSEFENVTDLDGLEDVKQASAIRASLAGLDTNEDSPNCLTLMSRSIETPRR